jgi:hypothetical protein
MKAESPSSKHRSHSHHRKNRKGKESHLLKFGFFVVYLFIVVVRTQTDALATLDLFFYLTLFFHLVYFR